MCPLDAIQDAVKTYLSSLAANSFAEGIEKLVSRYDKCLNRFDDYVEKYVRPCCTFGNKIIMLCQSVFFYSPSEFEKKSPRMSTADCEVGQKTET